jgi:hypothetical protein
MGSLATTAICKNPPFSTSYTAVGAADVVAPSVCLEPERKSGAGGLLAIVSGKDQWAA